MRRHVQQVPARGNEITKGVSCRKSEIRRLAEFDRVYPQVQGAGFPGSIFMTRAMVAKIIGVSS